MRTPILPLLVVLGACGIKGDEEPYNPYSDDADGDGQSPAKGDCDDTNPDIYQGADEYCNGVDDDCDGETDEKAAVDSVVWYADLDGDGYGNEKAAQRACEQPGDNFVEDGTDCDDTDPTTSPAGTEDCTDGADNDCNGKEDCEEAVCGDLYVCDEVSCDNRIDDDDDGLVDCDDDACWGMPPCAEEVSNLVTGGTMALYRRHWSYNGGDFKALNIDRGWMWMTSVTGTARAKFSDRTITCTWAMSGASIYGTSVWKSDGIAYADAYQAADAERGNIVMNGDGCTYWGSSALPSDDDWLIGARPYRSPSGASASAVIGERVTTWDSFDLPTRIVPFYVGSVTGRATTYDGTYTFSTGMKVTYFWGWVYADLKPWAPYTFTPTP